MLKNLRERLTEWLQRAPSLPVITEDSSLHEIASHFPAFYEFLERKYGIKVDGENRVLGLKVFVERFGLPPARIVFMEAQMSERAAGVKVVSAREAQRLLTNVANVRVFDVREGWELKICRIEGSESLTPEKLDGILNETGRDMPFLLYCHYGVRSFDAATYLVDRGFTRVHVIQGGIDAWAAEIDPDLPRYDQAYC